jgi:hypothetical protein
VSFGWNDPFLLAEFSSEPVAFENVEWQNHYTSFIDLRRRIHELENDIASVQDDIDTLEHERDEIEEALDQGYSEWEEKEYRKAEAIIERASPLPPLPEEQLLGENAFACLSDDARRILETYYCLSGIYANESDLQKLDSGPLIAAMAKACERILADFLEPRCRVIYADPSVSSLLNDPKRTVAIPVEDQSFKIDKGSLQKVLGLIKKPGPLQLSGTRNGAIALLLFGRTYKMGESAEEEIRNPLKIHGDEEQRKELRLDLYRFQQLRNRFIHHELAEWIQAQEAKHGFEACLHGLISILFGISPF